MTNKNNQQQRIITLSFSPCIDKSSSVPQLIPEKKLHCDIPKLEPGGGGINVARAILHLGGEAEAIYPSGGYTGKFLQRLMQEERVRSRVVETEQETRENMVVFEEASGQQFRFGFPPPVLSPQEWERLLQAVEEAGSVRYIVASGSLPIGYPPDIFIRLASMARSKRARLIVDTPGIALLQAVEAGVFLVKPNLGELCQLVGKEYLYTREVPWAARQLIKKGKCEIVLASMGADGAMLVTEDMIHRIVPPKLTRKSTVGAGDSMVAGVVLSLARGKNLLAAVRYGVACGTAATLNPGTALCSRADADRIEAALLTAETNHLEKI